MNLKKSSITWTRKIKDLVSPEFASVDYFILKLVVSNANAVNSSSNCLAESLTNKGTNGSSFSNKPDSSAMALLFYFDLITMGKY